MRLLFIIPVVLASLLFLSTKIGSAGIVKPQAIDVQERIAYHANKWNLEVRLVKAIAKVESNFNLSAKNPSDPSYGLMQITPMLAQDYGLIRDYEYPTDLEIEWMMEVNNNLSVGCWYLNKLSKYPFDQMVQSYNVGEYGYNVLGRRNFNYLERVRGYYEKY